MHVMYELGRREVESSIFKTEAINAWSMKREIRVQCLDKGIKVYHHLGDRTNNGGIS